MFYKLMFTCLISSLIASSISAHGHDHDHDHDHHGHSHEEPPSFKYSKSANEQYQQQQHEHHTHRKTEHHTERKQFTSTSELWLQAMGSTLLISAAPFFILFFVPLDSTDQEQPLLKILLAFASGGLLGDAFLHLIPHATMSVESGGGQHSHSHSHGDEEGGGHSHDMSVGLWVLAGIVTFLMVEKVVRIMKNGGHGHTHSKPKADNHLQHKKHEKTEKTKTNGDEIKKSTAQTSAQQNSTLHQKPDPLKEIKVAGYLNLAADFSHNFTDGLAIGSSYLAGNTVGMVTTITILLHEVPHEIGDFAILLQSGVSRKNAMLLQLTTAVGAVAGTAISLMAQNTAGNTATQWILPFTAGGFIYIALVSVIPELLDEERPSIVQTLLQLLAMLAGVGMMVIIAEYE